MRPFDAVALTLHYDASDIQELQDLELRDEGTIVLE